MRQIEFQNRSEKFIRKLEKAERVRVLSDIQKLLDDPIPGPPKTLHLREHPGLLRMKVGPLRVIFSINEVATRVVLVAYRGDDRVYERLQRLLGS